VVNGTSKSLQSGAIWCKSVQERGSKVQTGDAAPVSHFGEGGPGPSHGRRLAICMFQHLDTLRRQEVNGLLMKLAPC